MRIKSDSHKINFKMYSNQKFNESKKWKQLQEIINDSDDDVLEMHFTKPE